MTKINHICLFTATGAENLGDELITLCEIHELQRFDREILITVFSHDVARTRRFFLSQKLNLEKITIQEYFPNHIKNSPFKNISLLRNTIKTIQKCDHIFVGGGGLFYGQSDEGHSPLKLWWMRAFFAKFFKKPLTYLSLGISVKSAILADKAQMLFGGQKTITLRDHESLEVVRSLGYSGQILPDPVLAYSPKGVDALSSKTIGIALRKGFLENETVTQIIRRLMAKGYKILLLPHSLHPTDEASHDGYYLQDFLLPGVETTQSIEQTLEGYKKCHIIIAMRFHSMILAIDSHIPFVGMSYGKKTNELLTEISWKHAFGVGSVTADSVIHSIENIELNYNSPKMKLTDTHRLLQQSYHDIFDQIIGK